MPVAVDNYPMTFRITFQSDGCTFTSHKNETVLAAALRNGFNLPYGCRNGSCGSCKGKLISGKIDYPSSDLTGLTDTERAAGMVLFCQAKPLTDIVIQPRQVVQNGQFPPIRKLPCRVMKIEKLNHDVIRLFMKLPSSERLQFLPGQYIDILMQDNKHRSFSLANAPHDDEFLELHVRHYDGGVFSEYAFNTLREKALLRIEGPLGTFSLNETSQRPMIMIAGGTGFAPVKSIIEHSLQRGLQREIFFYWGARTRADLYLHPLANGWAQQHRHIHYVPVLSENHDKDWRGRNGLVHEAVLKDFSDLQSYEVYACGPPPMVHAVHDTFIERGMPEDLIYSDSFEIAPGK